MQEVIELPDKRNNITVEDTADGPLVSIVVPVFNVGTYLEECVHSLINQTYANIEVLLVNDGSSDDSLSVCERVASTDCRITVLDKQNGGLSDARNAGLCAANGEWVCFVDGDDYVSPIFVESLLYAARTSGCSIAAVPFGTKFFEGEKADLICKMDEIPLCGKESAKDYIEDLLYQSWDTGVPWRIYKREILGSAPFKTGIYYEDLESVYRIVHDVNEVALLDERGLYAYRMRGNSIMGSSYSSIKGESALMIAEQMTSDLESWYPDLSRAVASRCFSLCRVVYAQLPLVPSRKQDVAPEKHAIWKVLCDKRKIVLCDRGARKKERLAAFIACFGSLPFQLFCLLCRALGLMR